MNRVAVVIVAAIAIIAILVAALPFLISGDFLRGRISAEIAALTGRPVAISGDPSLSLYPLVAITVDGLTVGNPEGMGDDAFIAADGLRATMRVLPLLIGRLEFDEFELIKPRVRLVVSDDGRANWQMDKSAIAAQAKLAALTDAPARGAPAGSEQPSGDVRIGRLKVTDGIILYDDLASDHREEMTAVELDVAWPSASTAVGGSGSFLWRGETVEFNGSVANPLALIAGGASPVRFAAATTALRVSFAGRANGVDSLQLDGSATATTPSLRRAIEWMGTPMGTGSILGAGSIDGTIHWAGWTASFDVAVIELDGNGATGSLSADFGGSRPSVQGTLAADTIDLSPYVEAMRADLVAEGSWLIAPARLAFAEAIDADLRISASQALIGATRIGKMAAAVTIRSGVLDVSVGEAQFYGGTLEARIGAAMAGDMLVGRAEAKLSNVPAGVALSDLVAISVLDGTAAVSLTVAGRGASWGELARSVGGTAKVAIVDGSLAGFDVSSVAEVMADPLSEPMRPGTATTAFADLTATLTISEGNLTTDDLTMTGEGFALAMAGKGSVLNGLVDAKARIMTERDEVPIAITGRWRVPTIARDTTTAAPEEDRSGSDALQPSGG